MKKTNIIYILLTVLIFFCGADGVDADSFQCIYQFDVPKDYRGDYNGNKIKSKLSILLEQEMGESPSYKISYDGATTYDDSSWEKFDQYESGMSIDNNSYSVDSLSICPTVAFYVESLPDYGVVDPSQKIRRIILGDDRVNGNQNVISGPVAPVYDTSEFAYEIDIVSDEWENETCEEKLGPDLVERIQSIVDLIKIAVPIILIIYGIIDFGKAIFIGDENEMKKVQSKFIKRLIIAVGFFLVPTVVQLLLNIAHQVWPEIDPSLCGIKF